MKKFTVGNPHEQLGAAATKRNSAHMLPATDDILERAVNISVGVVDKGLGSGTGININSTEEEINAVAKHLREVIESL